MRFFPCDSRTEIAVVNEPSLFEPLKFYCISNNFGIIENIVENKPPLLPVVDLDKICFVEEKSEKK